MTDVLRRGDTRLADGQIKLRFFVIHSDLRQQDCESGRLNRGGSCTISWYFRGDGERGHKMDL
jgi:hypothetical protein